MNTQLFPVLAQLPVPKGPTPAIGQGTASRLVRTDVLHTEDVLEVTSMCSLLKESI